MVGPEEDGDAVDGGLFDVENPGSESAAYVGDVGIEVERGQFAEGVNDDAAYLLELRRELPCGQTGALDQAHPLGEEEGVLVGALAGGAGVLYGLIYYVCPPMGNVGL